MPTQGIYLVIDDDFRAKNTCRYCEEALGALPFAVLILLDKPHDMSYQHIHCAKLLVEAENAASVKPS